MYRAWKRRSALLLLICVLTMNGGALTAAGAVDFVVSASGTGNLDAHIDYNGWSTFRYGIGETLFILDDNLRTVPCLATGYTLSDDKLTWTITLHRNVKFHSGRDMDAAAVKASLERVVKLNARAAEDLLVDAINVNENTVIITTKVPNPTLINSLCDPYACILDLADEGNYNMYPTGTGPYKVKTFNQDISIILERFNDYWNGSPKCDTVTIRVVTDSDTLTMALQNGEIDVAYGIPYDALTLFRNDSQFKISQASTSRVFMLYFNFEHEFMNDINFRRAVSMAIDKEAYASVLLNGSGTATKSAFPSYLPYGNDGLVDAPNYDPEGAKSLLAQSGYVDSDGDGFLDKDGEKISLRLVSYRRTGLPIQAEAVQSALIDLGIDVVCNIVDNVSAVLNAGDFDICVYAYVTTPTGDPLNYLNFIMGTGKGGNFGKYSNAEVDALLVKLYSEFNVNERTDLTIKIQQLAQKDYAYCFITHLNMALVMKGDVVGIKQSPVDYYMINIETGKQ